MARDESPPFKRGQTFYGGAVPTAAADLIAHADLEGKTWRFEDIDYSLPGTTSFRSGKYVTCMLVRNVHSTVILPSDVVVFNVAGSGVEYLGQVKKAIPTLGERTAVADEYLPAAGVAVNDLFWVVIAGPTMAKTDTAGDTTLAINDIVIPGATTAGRVIGQDQTVAAGAATFAQVNGELGRAVKAVAATSTLFLIDVTPKIAA